MYLQRQYTSDELARHAVERAKAQAEGREPGRAKPSHFLVKHTGHSQAQNFADRSVHEWIACGAATIEGDTLTLKAEPEDLVYTIKRSPGYYCVSTGEQIPISSMAWTRMKTTGQGDLSAREAKAWLLARGLGERDYEVTNAYECVLNDAQHERFRAVQDAKGRIVGAHQMEA